MNLRPSPRFLPDGKAGNLTQLVLASFPRYYEEHMDKLKRHHKAIATQGLLRGLLADDAPPDLEGSPLTEEQREQAIRQYRLEVVENFPLEDLLEIVARRSKTDRQFRAGVRLIESRSKPDKAGRLAARKMEI